MGEKSYLCKKNEKLIEKFKNTQDFIDICYMIDHIKDINIRISLLEELGYRVGSTFVTDDKGEKHIFVGKQGELRIQVTPKFSSINLARSIIFEKDKIQLWIPKT